MMEMHSWRKDDCRSQNEYSLLSPHLFGFETSFCPADLIMSLSGVSLFRGRVPPSRATFCGLGIKGEYTLREKYIVKKSAVRATPKMGSRGNGGLSSYF
jgi:hypothetical protein